VSFAPGTRILVAGASGGLGREVVRQLEAHDVVVGAHYHTNRDALDGLRAETFQADLSSADGARGLLDAFVAFAGGIDVLIQLSGDLHRPAAWDELDEAGWRHDLDVNLTAPFLCTQAAFRIMKPQGGGRIINVASIAAQRVSIAYGVAKAGIAFLAKALARVGAPDGILVNAVAPGLIDTPFHVERAQRTQEQLRERAALVPLERAGTPAEVAALVLFLAGSESSYITGECVAVSGGDWL
jgi:3-oxoacyl-[acyl-carrier protein] reductase